MKFIKLPLLALLFLSPFLLSAQAFVGQWTMSGTTPEGKTVTNTVSFADDGTLTVDFDSDGSIEVRSSYTIDGDVVSIIDTSDESPCTGVVGKYRITISGDELTATLVDDPCDARRSEVMKMKRLE